MPTTNTGFTLTHATHLGRLTVKFGAIGLVALMVGRIFWGAFITYWKATHPPPPPPPTVGFDVLPQPRFPIQDSSEKPSSYVLETATGTTPDLGDRAKVFLMIRSSLDLLADERARQTAASYDFIFEPEVLDSFRYRWSRSEPLEAKLEMNIQNQHFTLKTDYLKRPELLANPELPDDFEAVSRVKTFLGTADMLPRDVATSSGTVTYLKTLGGELTPAVSLSDADFLQVDLNRSPIDDQYPIVTTNGRKGSIHAIIAGNLASNDSVVELSYTYQAADYTEVHTYPLRTTQSALKLLQAGEGYVVHKGSQDQAIIRGVSLAYYDDIEEQDYLQPVYVFEGDDGFLALVPAVSPEYLQSE